MSAPTTEDQRTREAIWDYHRIYGMAPTLDDLGKALGLRSRSAVHRRVERLVKLGWVRRKPRASRTLVVVE